MYTKLYNIFKKKSTKVKQKINKAKQKNTKSNDPEIKAIERSTKLKKALRSLGLVGTFFTAFAFLNISVPFSLAAIASSIIIHGYGMESDDKKRKAVLKRIEENTQQQAKFDSQRQKGKLQLKPEYEKSVGQAKVNRYFRKHARQEAHIASLKKGQLTTSILTTAAALATFVTPFAGPLFALTTVGLATANGIIKNRTNKAEAEMEKDTEKYNDFANEYNTWQQQCDDQKQRAQQQNQSQQPTQQNTSQRAQPRTQQPAQTPVRPRAQQPAQTPVQPRTQRPIQQPTQPQNMFDQLVYTELRNNPHLTLNEAIDRVNQQFAAWQSSAGKKLTK